MTASEKLRARKSAPDEGYLDCVLLTETERDLIADVVEAAEQVAYADEAVAPGCMCPECVMIRALTALTAALEGDTPR